MGLALLTGFFHLYDLLLNRIVWDNRDIFPRLSQISALFIQICQSLASFCIFLLAKMAMSTRRFFRRPASVVLSAMGCDSPYPFSSTREVFTPCCSRKLATASARCLDSFRLCSSEPVASAWPSTIISVSSSLLSVWAKSISCFLVSGFSAYESTSNRISEPSDTFIPSPTRSTSHSVTAFSVLRPVCPCADQLRLLRHHQP